MGMPRVGCLCEWQADPSALHAFADADWAGDGQSKTSVSGGILDGRHLIKAWTTHQSIVATSPAESQTVRWQPRSRKVDGGSGVRQRPVQSCADSAAHRLQWCAINNKQSTAWESTA